MADTTAKNTPALLLTIDPVRSDGADHEIHSSRSACVSVRCVRQPRGLVVAVVVVPWCALRWDDCAKMTTTRPREGRPQDPQT